jgi:DNA (cytosine-5)-methyltransferase 1
MRYLSVCSGIEAASVAWEPLGWEAAAFSEIEAFPRAVLAHHYPNTPLHGDFTTIAADQYGTVDLLVGGTPCQSFSLAGLRKGLADERGVLALEFARLAQRIRPRWVVWENVPGALSSNGGRDFGAILGALEELGYGWAYRTLDAQHFGVPQRRRRVFVVGYRGDWRPPAKVLLERPRTDWNPAPIAGEGHRDATTCWWDGGQLSQTLDAVLHKKQALPEKNRFPAVVQGGKLRYITPVEAERLQGFPDNWTRIPWRGRSEEQCPDGPRYKAIGNSMAVPVMRWIGTRIAAVEAVDRV